MPLTQRPPRRDVIAVIKLVFWLLVALDALGIALWLILGLAAAGSSRTSPLTVTLLLFVLPALLLGAAAMLFTRSSSPVLRVVAFALAAAPLVILVTSAALARQELRANSNAAGELTFFRTGPMRDVAEAIGHNDTTTMRRLLTSVDVNQPGMSDMTLLMVAMRQLRLTPLEHGSLTLLVEAGANPNSAAMSEWPLSVAIQVEPQAGTTPLQLLLAAGADPNLINEFGDPLFFTAIGASGTVSLELMLRHGAKVNLVTRSNQSALMHTANTRNWRAARLLLEAGADPALGRSVNDRTFAQMVETQADSPDPAGDLAWVREHLQQH